MVEPLVVVVVVLVEPPGIDVVLVVGPPGGTNVIVDFLSRTERATKRPVSSVPLPMIIFALGAQA